MFLSKFSFSSFRGFVDEQVVHFAIPDTLKIGSGLTYIVGENNTGKTSILEGMHFFEHNYSQSQLRTSDIKNDSIHFTIFDKDGDKVQDLVPIRQGSYSLKNMCTDAGSSHFTNSGYPIFVPSRRYWSPIVNNDMDIYNAKNQPYGHNTALRQTPNSSSDNQMADLFHAIEKDDQSYNRFLETMQKVFTDFSSFTTINEDTAQISYVLADTMHRADFLGDGVVSVMRIVAHLVSHSDRPIIIDEPELSLHPSAQKRLKTVLAEASKSQQIVIATHSPYLVDWEYIKNGAVLHRVVKDNISTANIYTLKEYSAYAPLISGGNWQQPHVADIVSKEIFFSDKILFLEGQEDVGLLRSDGILNEDITLFGYGVRGFQNFKFALQLAKDIGIQKAGAIVDKGDNEDSVLDELTTLFPDYCIVQWDREDIRDKNGWCPLDDANQPVIERKQMPKRGYFDANGHKKPETGDYDEKIRTINEYFDH